MFSWQRRVRKGLILLVTLGAISKAEFWPFPPKRFIGNALLDAGSLGLGNDERAVAFGDFNGDQFLDVVTLDASGRRVTIHLWNHGDFIFSDAASFSHSEQIYNVVPGDFTHDGTLDLLVMSRGPSSSVINIEVYVGSPGNGFVSPPISVPSSNAAQPIPLDANDILLVCDEEGTSNKYFQIWRNDKSEGFTLAQFGRLPSGVQVISFADMDRDGTIDMVFATCASVSSSTGIGKDCYINIAYNQQLPLCASPANTAAFTRFPLTDIFPSNELLVLDTRSSPPVPLPLRLGDANLDGFPDLLFVTATVPRGGFLGIGETRDRTPRLVLSTSCMNGIPGCDNQGSGRVGWKPVKKDANALSDVADASGVAFLDIDEDGTLDVMVQRTGEQGQGPILFVQNNFFFDAFFLKAIVLNGACDNGWCSRPNGTGHYHPFGVSYSGASFKYTILDTKGARSAAQVAQLPQTAYQALLPPYAFFGLGRTNNYIENLFVGSTLHSASDSPEKEQAHFVNMEGVIPNSKVVIYPPTHVDGAWRRELYLRPGAWIPWVTLTVIVTVVLLAVVVFVLHLNEKRADELERRRASHHINFDAL
ncbi:hypothetical protein EW145_g4893 [Phellinidium pouzarii]|uniref:T-cell immunomodulatory protein TIP C2 domain-containing protein n=1 Tax=Phellinidium pouzarii TaxID=167371 RepID=A0A4S4L1W3_9AGAM|nr:hypothetical protein EW145_g4893 [Phellinidium pouzarii]